MSVGPHPTVVWMSNVELFMLLVSLTEEGTRYQSRAVSPIRRTAWLRYDRNRRAPAVVETSRLLADGCWVDAITELALSAEALPKIGFAYPVSRETIQRAARGETDGVARLARYLEYAGAFSLDGQVPDFLRSHGEAYRAAVAELEGALGGLEWLGGMEQYFGTSHRSYLCVASLLMPAGFTFGISISAPEGPLAFYVAGPYIEPDGQITFASPGQAAPSAEREFARAFLKPVLSRGQITAQAFGRIFERGRDTYAAMGYQSAQDLLEDQLAQVVQARLMARRGESAAAEALLKYDEESGFPFARQFAAALEDYELHRTDFPDMEAFFPRLMDLVQ